MKKLTPRFRRWLIFQAKRQRRHQTTPRVGHILTASGIRLIRLSDSQGLPETLCLDRALPEALDFFFHLRTRTVNRGIPSLLRSGRSRNIGWLKGYTDFTTVRSISSGAALILAAEYDRIFRVGSAQPATVDLDQWDDQVYSSLYNLGFFKLFGLEPGRASLPPPSDSSVIQAPMVRGEDTNWSEAGETLLNLFHQVGGNDALRVNLLGAIVDAIENVRGHAYGGRTPLQERLIPAFWWLSGAADTVKRRLTLSIYDQGNTIPVTLPKVWPFEAITKAFMARFGHHFDLIGPEHDREALEIAMQLSSTSTGLSERGKGLSKIRHVVADCPGARLRVLSRRGNYVYHDGVDTYSATKIPLLGTYIEIEASF